jgi:hypothetical protein
VQEIEERIQQGQQRLVFANVIFRANRKLSLSLPVEAARTSSGYQVSQGNGEQERALTISANRNPKRLSQNDCGAAESKWAQHQQHP